MIGHVTAGATNLARVTSGRRARGRAIKHERLRATVERVALQLFRQHGFDEVTVERIAAERVSDPRRSTGIWGRRTACCSRTMRDGFSPFVTRSRCWTSTGPRPHELHDLLVTVVGIFTAELETLKLRDEIMARTPGSTSADCCRAARLGTGAC
jgi:hypothetical protein